MCILLERKIGREPLCHHHVKKLILPKIFTLYRGPSNSPYIPTFKRFKSAQGGVPCNNFRKIENQELMPFIYQLSIFSRAMLKRITLKSQRSEMTTSTHPASNGCLRQSTINNSWSQFIMHAGWPNYCIPSKYTSFVINVIHSISQRRKKLRLIGSCRLVLLLLWVKLGRYESVDHEINITARKVLENHLQRTFCRRYGEDY